MRLHWGVAAALALAVRLNGAPAPVPAIATSSVIQVDFSDPELSPPQWTLVLHPDGSGHFRSQMEPKAGMKVIEVTEEIVNSSPQISKKPKIETVVVVNDDDCIAATPMPFLSENFWNLQGDFQIIKGNIPSINLFDHFSIQSSWQFKTIFFSQKGNCY